MPTAARASVLAAAVTMAALAGCGGSTTASSTSAHTASAPAAASAGASTVVSASSGALTAMMHGSTHTPRVGVLWPVSFAVTSAGSPAPASVSYEFLLAGQVVARRSTYHFTGTFHDTLQFPAAAVGYPLTVRSVIVSGPTTLYLDYPVRVTR